MAALSAGVVLILPGCSAEERGLTVKEVNQCAKQRLGARGDRFSTMDTSIAYSTETENGLAEVIVTFDGDLKPVSTFFVSTPHGSHRKMMDAANVIKNCAGSGRN